MRFILRFLLVSLGFLSFLIFGKSAILATILICSSVVFPSLLERDQVARRKSNTFEIASWIGLIVLFAVFYFFRDVLWDYFLNPLTLFSLWCICAFVIYKSEQKEVKKLQ